MYPTRYQSDLIPIGKMISAQYHLRYLADIKKTLMRLWIRRLLSLLLFGFVLKRYCIVPELFEQKIPERKQERPRSDAAVCGV